MGKKSMSLGKGLGDILRDHDVSDTSKVPIHLIDANPFQPRKHFDEESLKELAESIKQHGILQPILLRKNSGRYEIVDGERRVRAAKLAGLTEIEEARVFELLSDKKMAEWAIIGNIQRENLNPIETANSYHQLIEAHCYTHDDLANILNKSRAAITNSLRLLKLSEQVKNYVAEGKLSAGAARTLLSLNTSNQEKAAKKIIDSGLSVRAAEAIAITPKRKKDKEPLSPDMKNFLNILQNAFGTKVECKSSTIIIHYSSYEDLTRIQAAVNAK
jgi:ParB family chromosome partitioning protein